VTHGIPPRDALDLAREVLAEYEGIAPELWGAEAQLAQHLLAQAEQNAAMTKVVEAAREWGPHVSARVRFGRLPRASTVKPGAIGRPRRSQRGQVVSGKEDLALWQAFAARIKLTLPFRVDVIVRSSDRKGDRVMMGVELHVPERDTREPITVLTQRHCAPWTTDDAAIEMLFDLLDIALRHEAHESVRLDGALVRELHKYVPPRTTPSKGSE
jgi:hypothetical protein